MASNYIVYLLVSLVLVQEVLVLDQKENEVNIDSQGDAPIVGDIAFELLKNKNLENVGSVLSNLVKSADAKDVSGMLSGMLADGNAADMLQGLGSMLATNSQGGIDPAVIGSLMNMMANQNQQRQGQDSEFDMSGILSLLGGFMGQMNGNNLLGALPMLLQTLSDFSGPEAEARQEAHKEHESLLPPLFEKFHIFFDHFMHSEVGKRIFELLGTDKIVKVFADKNGNFNYQTFVEKLENHSFRKHWISMVTNRIGHYLSYFTDPVLRKKYIMSGQYIINNFLEKNGFPRKVLLDMSRPADSISALVNYVSEMYLNTPIDAKYYVKPAVQYAREVFRLAESRGYLTATSSELSNKLADTINLEIIEPIARVNRAFKYANRFPKCDRYVICLVNQAEESRGDSLPGLKKLLYRVTSYVASWFLGSTTGTPFLSYYKIISEGSNCKAFYRETCDGFHDDEVRVTTEYVHNEL